MASSFISVLSVSTSMIRDYFGQLIATCVQIVLWWILLPHRMFLSIFARVAVALGASTKLESAGQLAAEKKKSEALAADVARLERQGLELQAELAHARRDGRGRLAQIDSLKKRCGKLEAKLHGAGMASATEIVRRETNWIIWFNYLAIALTLYAVTSILSVAPSSVERKLVYVLCVPVSPRVCACARASFYVCVLVRVRVCLQEISDK